MKVIDIFDWIVYGGFFLLVIIHLFKKNGGLLILMIPFTLFVMVLLQNTFVAFIFIDIVLFYNLKKRNPRSGRSSSDRSFWDIDWGGDGDSGGGWDSGGDSGGGDGGGD